MGGRGLVFRGNDIDHDSCDSLFGDAIEMAKACQPLELLEIDASRAYECLGAIIGEAVEEDIINEVFARFCLGK